MRGGVSQGENTTLSRPEPDGSSWQADTWHSFSEEHSSSDNDGGESLPSVEQLLHRALVGITPSFLQHWVEEVHSPPPRLHAIAALDGLRGWACMLVFNFHFFFTYTHKTMTGWGFGGENWGFHHLPIIHLLISGHVMVAIFFVISGYVLSHKPLKLMRSNSWEQVFHTLASASFRRALRLYIPALVGIFVVFIAVLLGAYDYSIAVRDAGHTVRGINEEHPEIFSSSSKQFWNCYATVVRLMDPWNWGLYYNDYNPQLWTIPVEFRCSIVLFLTMLVTSRLRARCRLSLVAALLWFCVRWGRWDVVLFLSGMFMAELDLACGLWDPSPSSASDQRDPEDPEDPEKTTAATTSRSRVARSVARHHRLIWLGIFILGLYLASSPNTGAANTPGYRLLYRLTPETYPEPHRFLQSLGAITIVASINHSADLQRAFTNSLAQYLGRISFAFYIVHGPILHSLGYSIMPNIWLMTGKETDARYCAGFVVGYAICLAVSVWAGDVFWRAVDVPSVRFSRWVESRVIVPSLL